ncbi:MAG: hypothetical protein ABW168_07550 [Sedimenticola sp.]
MSVLVRLPVALSRMLGRLLGQILYYISNCEKQVAEINLSLTIPLELQTLLPAAGWWNTSPLFITPSPG